MNEQPTEPRVLDTNAVVESYNENADLDDVECKDFDRPGVVFSSASMRRANFSGGKLSGANLKNCEGVRAIFIKTDLSGADMTGSNWCGADFSFATLKDADLSGCTLDTNTSFDRANVEGMKIDAYTLRTLGDQRGLLTEAAIATLKIRDDRATLISTFGGFWSRIHLLAVLLFVSPYVIFVVDRYVRQLLHPCIDCEKLRVELWNYVLAGPNNSFDVLGLTLFALLVMYNIFRVSLVIKANSLDLLEQASGIRAKFEFSGYWRFAYVSCSLLVWLNLALVLIHTYRFMGILVAKSSGSY